MDAGNLRRSQGASLLAVMFFSQGDPGFEPTDGTRGPVRNPKTLAEVDFLPFSDCVSFDARACDCYGSLVFLGGLPGLSYTAVPPLVKTPDGFQAFVHALQSEVIAFGKPVAYVHGDSHYFETFGDNQGNGVDDCNWLKVYVDPHSREVFAYQPQIVPANQSLITLLKLQVGEYGQFSVLAYLPHSPTQD